jgi:hypothetical protein
VDPGEYYSQRKYRKNALVVGNGDDGDDRENPQRCRFKIEEMTNRKGSSTWVSADISETNDITVLIHSRV